MTTLFNGNHSDSDSELKINSDYAKNYDRWREKEELNKLKTKYGETDSSDSSSSEDDDDKAIENREFDKEFYKTLACLKKKDPCIYDEEVKFFNNIDKSGTSTENAEVEERVKKKSKKEKALFLRDYERTIIMERDGQFSSSENEDDIKQKAETKTYVMEQQELKDSFKHALKDEDENEDEDKDEHTGFLKIRQKTEDEKQKEEESYKEWLKGQKSEIVSQEQEELKPLRDFWTDPNLDANEKFLRDYILNNKWTKNTDKKSSNVNLDYNQIAHDSDENLSEDEKNIQKQEEFEHKYNFRFEEPDQEFIKRYPRTIENSIRKKDTRRAQKRAEVRQRKQEEKQQKREELKQLKALKRKEIEEKIEKLKEITGNTDMRFDNVDFDADFDPNEHDRKMNELFDEEYYACEDDTKPEFPELDEELEIESTWDNYDPNVDKIDAEDAPQEQAECEDPDFNMDADYDGSRDLQSELIESTKKRKRRKRSKAFAALIAKEKPRFDPQQFPSYQDYFEQYYSLDYEDMIGDLPCRFKYRKVVPNDYGLGVEEILMADDKELNKWCSLKKALQYKPEHVEMKEVQSYKQRAANEALKRRILKSLYTEPDEKEEGGAGTSGSTKNVEQADTGGKKRRRKKRTKVTYNLGVDFANAGISKEESVDTVVKNSARNDTRDGDDDEEEKRDETARGKDDAVANKGKERKRKNADGDGPSIKLMKLDNMQGEDARSKAGKSSNGETTSVENSSALTEGKKNGRKERKKLGFDRTRPGKHNRPNDGQMMSLNAERLRTYGLNAKKFKNKLKYGNKKF